MYIIHPKVYGQKCCEGGKIFTHLFTILLHNCLMSMGSFILVIVTSFLYFQLCLRHVSILWMFISPIFGFVYVLFILLNSTLIYITQALSMLLFLAT
jgi:hypothetical protein